MSKQQCSSTLHFVSSVAVFSICLEAYFASKQQRSSTFHFGSNIAMDGSLATSFLFVQKPILCPSSDARPHSLVQASSWTFHWQYHSYLSRSLLCVQSARLFHIPCFNSYLVEARYVSKQQCSSTFHFGSSIAVVVSLAVSFLIY